MSNPQALNNQQIDDAGLADWRKLAQALHARFVIPDYAVGAAFVAALAKAADAKGHHPDVRLTSGVGRRVAVHAGVRIVGDGTGPGDGRRPSATSPATRGSRPDPPRSPSWRWRSTRPTRTVSGRSGRCCSPAIRATRCTTRSSIRPAGCRRCGSKGTEAHPTPRQRWHFDVWLAPEVADDRIRAADRRRRHRRRRLLGSVVHACSPTATATGSASARSRTGVVLEPPGQAGSAVEWRSAQSRA